MTTPITVDTVEVPTSYEAGRALATADLAAGGSGRARRSVRLLAKDFAAALGGTVRVQRAIVDSYCQGYENVIVNTNERIAAQAAGEKLALYDRFNRAESPTWGYISKCAIEYAVGRFHEQGTYRGLGRAYVDGYVATYCALAGVTWEAIRP